VTVTITSQAEVGSELSVKAPPAGSIGQPGARVAEAATGAAQRSTLPAICGLAFVIMIESAWVGLLAFVALRLILR
jgi:hypothetical protein